MVLVQQDILDFYSLLCGVSVWKESANEEEEEEIPESVLFNCKLQLLSPYNGMFFVSHYQEMFKSPSYCFLLRMNDVISAC